MRSILITLAMMIGSCIILAGQSSTPTPSPSPTPGESSSKPQQPSSSSSESRTLSISSGEDSTADKTPDSKPRSKATADQEYTHDMDVGEFYLNEKTNYAGAVGRFRDALECKPNDPTATYQLAQALEGMHEADEAREHYAAYLKLDPKGTFATLAKRALERLRPRIAAQPKSKLTSD